MLGPGRFGGRDIVTREFSVVSEGFELLCVGLRFLDEEELFSGICNVPGGRRPRRDVGRDEPD